MEKLEKIFIDGKMIDLDSTDISDLERYLDNIKNKKKISIEKMDNFLEQIYS